MSIMKKRVIFIFFIPFIIALVALTSLNVLLNIKHKIYVAGYDGYSNVYLGNYSVKCEDDYYLIKNKQKFLDEVSSSKYLYKKVDDNEFILYSEGYYFRLKCENNIVTIDNYVYDSKSVVYESFSLENLVPNIKMDEKGYFYCEYLYNEIPINDFGIVDQDSLLRYFLSLNSRICIIDNNEISILMYSDHSLGYDFKIIFDDEKIVIYEKYYA